MAINIIWTYNNLLLAYAANGFLISINNTIYSLHSSWKRLPYPLHSVFRFLFIVALWWVILTDLKKLWKQIKNSHKSSIIQADTKIHRTTKYKFKKSDKSFLHNCTKSYKTVRLWHNAQTKLESSCIYIALIHFMILFHLIFVCH